MDRLQAMRVFTKVVETNGFSRAADSLNLPRASVTIIIQDLEAALKLRLLHRTTRRLSLTPEGALYYERSARILAEIDAMDSEVLGIAGTPTGKLRVDLPNAIGKLVLVPALEDFCSRFPAIDLSVGFGDRHADLIRDGIDCAIRVGALPDSSMVARRIASLPTVTVASPDYLQQYGTPAGIDDLEAHVCVRYHPAGPIPATDLGFVSEGGPVNVKMRPGLVVGDIEAQLACALQGLGIVQVPAFMAAPYLRSRGLVELLPQLPAPDAVVSIVYPQNRHLSSNVRTFADWAAQRFEQAAILQDRFGGRNREPVAAQWREAA